jgi:hypothetical protein
MDRMSERAQGRSEYRLCKDAKRDQRKDGQVTAKKECKKRGTRRKPGYLESDQRLSVCWLARRAPGRGILDLRRTLEQRVRLTKRPTNCTPIGKPDGVSDLRSIPGTYFPTIETSAANAHSQTMVAQPRSIELARRARLREYCRARLHCRGVSPPGLARRCQGRFR